MEILSQLKSVQQASRELVNLNHKNINSILEDLSSELLAQSKIILEANQKDLNRMDKNDPKYDRLFLNQERLEGISNDIKNVASLDSPLEKILEDKHLENNLHIQKITVPLGVIGIIYEARPNVTFDVFSLCFKSGNACVLKGGSDAAESNTTIVNIIHSVLKKHNVNENIVHLLSNDREETRQMMQATEYIDIIIPRGSQGLINFVRENSKVPVIETGAGIVHTYFDKTADLETGKDIIFNAKTRRVSVCNALDCLIIHHERISDLPLLVEKLAEKDVVVFTDEISYKILDGKYNNLQHATEEHFGTEFLSHKMSIKTVTNIQEAVNHINKHSSKHSEAILSKDEKNIQYFLKNVDAAAVYANTSTAFTDGAQFGLGAEIGISTQKLHARGPMALSELTSYKWIIQSEGEVRS